MFEVTTCTPTGDDRHAGQHGNAGFGQVTT